MGFKNWKNSFKSPYSIEGLDVSKDVLDKSIEVEKFKELMESEKLPIAISWQKDYLYFYAKDKTLLDHHLDELMKKLMSNPEKLEGLTFDKTLDQEIELANEKIRVTEPSAVKTKEVIL